MRVRDNEGYKSFGQMLGDTWVGFIMIPYIPHKVACSILHILKCLF